MWATDLGPDSQASSLDFIVIDVVPGGEVSKHHHHSRHEGVFYHSVGKYSLHSIGSCQ